MTNRNILTAIIPALALLAWTVAGNEDIISWKLTNKANIAGSQPAILGNPQINIEGKDTSFFFNGTNDGLVFPFTPIEGWQQFTIEVKFKPASDGPVAPRFMHFEDSALNRGTMELRLTPDKQWYLDAFLKNGPTSKGLTLIDSTKLHAADKWYWAAMVYDGKKMYSYVNGKKELEGEVDFPAMSGGRTSLGVRLNKVNWFKGGISEVRFHHGVLAADELQK
ncbi:MAG: LamG domain-containing protein [Chitinophagaceae bacterium]